MPTVGDFVDHLDAFAPPPTAAEWDNVGLLVGNASQDVRRAMTCLTLTEDVAAEAIRTECQLVVTHHPVLFRGVKKLTESGQDGRLLLPLIRAGVAVYSAHTAFDNCPDGINDGLARRLGLTDVESLRTASTPGTYKLAVFVPETDIEPVSAALFAAGAGRVGVKDRYTECSFRTPGTGTFFAGAETNPTVGRKGVREHVPEFRLETVVPSAHLVAAVKAMRAAHSYEEPAFDLYPLTILPPWGEGRIGSCDTTLGTLAGRCRRELRAENLQIVGDPSKPIRRVAVACGAAGEFLKDAIAAKADCFLTGEMRFHDCLTARAAGVAVLLPGHYATERPGVEDLARRLAKAFPDCEVAASAVERDPLAAYTHA
jgi:dinuclear metal center YbgI/SA1388 family protein